MPKKEKPTVDAKRLAKTFELAAAKLKRRKRISGGAAFELVIECANKVTCGT